jgi:hypothetical protein
MSETKSGPAARAWIEAVEDEIEAQAAVGRKKDRSAAVRAVVRKHPELHTAYIEEFNAACRR